MKKIITIAFIVLSSCNASKIITSPPINKPFKFARLAIVDNDGKARALDIHKIR